MVKAWLFELHFSQVLTRFGAQSPDNVLLVARVGLKLGLKKIVVKRLKQLIPPWNMPADPVKAVWWFMHWLLIALVHFFWIPILAMVVFETSLNWNTSGFLSGLVSGIITLLIGLVIWGLLSGLLAAVNLIAGVSHIISDVKRFQNSYTHTRGTPYPFMRTDTSNFKSNPKVVDSTAIEIEEES